MLSVTESSVSQLKVTFVTFLDLERASVVLNEAVILNIHHQGKNISEEHLGWHHFRSVVQVASTQQSISHVRL
jgi:hypothetical protein